MYLQQRRHQRACLRLLFYALLIHSNHLYQKRISGFYHKRLKITEKVSFDIASEASYVYILSGQKFIKNAKKWSILASF